MSISDISKRQPEVIALAKLRLGDRAWNEFIELVSQDCGPTIRRIFNKELDKAEKDIEEVFIACHQLGTAEEVFARYKHHRPDLER